MPFPRSSSRFSRYLVPGLVAMVAHAAVFFWPGQGRGKPPTKRSSATSVLLLTTAATDAAAEADAAGSAAGALADDNPPPEDRVVLPAPDLPANQKHPAKVEVEFCGAVATDLSGAARSGASFGPPGPASDWLANSPQVRGRAGHRGSNAHPLVAPLPPYPLAARFEGRTGVVELFVLLDPQGRPIKASVARSSGFADFDQAACDTVQRYWRFPPRLGAEKSVPPVRVAVHFDLTQL